MKTVFKVLMIALFLVTLNAQANNEPNDIAIEITNEGDRAFIEGVFDVTLPSTEAGSYYFYPTTEQIAMVESTEGSMMTCGGSSANGGYWHIVQLGPGFKYRHYNSQGELLSDKWVSQEIVEMVCNQQ